MTGLTFGRRISIPQNRTIDKTKTTGGLPQLAITRQRKLTGGKTRVKNHMRWKPASLFLEDGI